MTIDENLRAAQAHLALATQALIDREQRSDTKLLLGLVHGATAVLETAEQADLDW